MRPQGQKPIRFPSKTKEWFGKGVAMWWEYIGFCNKKADRQSARKQICSEMTQ